VTEQHRGKHTFHIYIYIGTYTSMSCICMYMKREIYMYLKREIYIYSKREIYMYGDIYMYLYAYMRAMYEERRQQ